MTTPLRERFSQLALSWRLWIFAMATTLGLTFLLSLNLVGASSVSVIEGQPAPNDVLAPTTISYTSDVLTAQAREQASNSVADVYTPFDLDIGRAQVSRAQALFAFVEVVRLDPQATTQTKLGYLQQVEIVTIDEQVAVDLLRLNQTDYQRTKEEVLQIISDLMSQEIQRGQVNDFQRAASRSSLVLTPIQNNVITNLSPQFIRETIFINESETLALREAAANGVDPVVREIPQDARFIEAGDTIDLADIEALQKFGLLQVENDWRRTASNFLASLLAVTILVAYWARYHDKLHENGRYLAALCVIVLTFALVAKLIVPRPGVWVYMLPISTFSLLLTVVYDTRISILLTIILAAMVGVVGSDSLELAVYTAAGGLASILTLRDTHRLSSFFRAGLAASLGHIMVILIFRLPTQTGMAEVSELALYALGNGVLAIALTLISFFIIGGVFGVTTTLQLQDLSRLDHPLLRDLLRRAPGTYHHSIMVANLAEQAAENIKANSALVRVGAFYHDIGKMNRPAFFTENQEGINPHDALDPYSSARIIVSHVSDGVEIAKKFRLPDRIRDFILEHHGTRVVKGFYMKAREQAGDEADAVDMDAFRHKGRRPRSRESGIVMLADAIEATSSALRPSTEKEIEKLVLSIVTDDITNGELNESGLTLGDIKIIRDSFIETLKGRFHVRVKYPGNDAMMQGTVPRGQQPVSPLATEENNNG